MVTQNLKNKRGKKLYLIVILFIGAQIGAISLFARHLVIKSDQQRWFITWLTEQKTHNCSEETNLASLKKRLLENSSLYGLYADLKKSLTVMKNSTKSGEVLELGNTQPEPFPRKVLIISSGRSGSSFLGELFNENKKAFYLFEPLAYSTYDNRKASAYEAKSFKIINDLYNCKFTDNMFLDFLVTNGTSKRWKSNKLASFPGQCSRISMSSKRCLAKILKYSCSDANSVIAKVLTHRLPQGGLWGIREILDANQDLRIIHLIRDPRRVIASMKKAGWFRGKHYASQVRDACDMIWGNIKHVKKESGYYKDRYKVLIFTEMMTNPFSTVVELYDFLKMSPVPEYVFSWIIENTTGSTKDNKRKGTTYKTFRNSTEVLNRKVDFTKFEDMVIKRYCSEVIRLIENRVDRST